MSYFPLDRDILTSSLWAEGSPEALKVWVYLMLSADPRDGVVRDSVPGIAMRCGLPVDVTEEVLTWLEAPDTHSRTKTDAGRRIRRTEDGFELVNYCARRDKDYSTPRVKRWRERQRSETDGTDETPGETEKRRFSVPETTNTNTNTNPISPDGLIERQQAGGQAPAPVRSKPDAPVPPSNPLVSGRRRELERELLGLVELIAMAQSRSAEEVIAQVGSYKGRRKVNPASMSDDRLLNTLLDAKKLARELGVDRDVDKPDRAAQKAWDDVLEAARDHPQWPPLAQYVSAITPLAMPDGELVVAVVEQWRGFVEPKLAPLQEAVDVVLPGRKLRLQAAPARASP